MANQRDGEIVDMRVDAIRSYSERVDSLIRSETASFYGDSPLYTFASRVNGAIRSSSASYEADYETYNSTTTNFPSHSQPHTLEDPYSHSHPQLFGAHQNLGTPAVHVHGFASTEDRMIIFTLDQLKAATDNFSIHNIIHNSLFGVLYRGKLVDGREVGVGIKESGTSRYAFQYELAILSRLHHKNLIELVGFCEEKDERLLVYKYTKNGALYDHLHNKNNVEKGSSVLNSWKIIALDVSRGIQYLHDFAAASIIHRDIRTSNILIDVTWTARLSNFKLAMVSPDHDERQSLALRGTVGFIDPEYGYMDLVTAKNDVYGFGVVLLELLTGKRAIFKYGENGGSPSNVVDFAVPAIMAGELVKILDPRVGPPDVNEAEAVELVADTAIPCVNLERKDRPTMADIVVNLERALASCDSSQDNISTGAICGSRKGDPAANVDHKIFHSRQD
ncbi:hypothetical protein Fmac_014585 [Flemingia macrophylla]|uniref:Protein kinase domain-containing protein n=1 Tax=Flemingia macrophylla TaxID=520843 RepID=A0ABD1MC45_9FABA